MVPKCSAFATLSPGATGMALQWLVSRLARSCLVSHGLVNIPSRKSVESLRHVNKDAVLLRVLSGTAFMTYFFGPRWTLVEIESLH